MKLNEFSLDKALQELGAAMAAPAPAPGAAPAPQQAPQGAPQQPDPKAMAARAAEVAAQKKEIQDAIKAKQMEIVELQKQLATIK